MATIIPTFAKIRGPGGGIDAVVVTWAGLASNGDIGQAIQRPDLADRSFQVAGAFGGANTVVCEGSNDGVNWFTLTNPTGGSISFAAAGVMQLTEAIAFVRPHVTGGAGGTMTVTMNLRRSYR
jgi:hypothetical protein